MNRALRLLPLIVLLCAARAAAQPTITSISSDHGGAVFPGAVTIMGTGFSTEPKLTRFVDVSNVDLFTSVSCSAATTCTALLPRPHLLPAGSQQIIAVFALVDGLKSTSSVNFRYYGAPLVSSITPSPLPISSATPVTVSGGAFPSPAAGLPGTITFELNGVNVPGACPSGASCNTNAPALIPTSPQGAVLSLAVFTPGGMASSFLVHGTAPPSPVISSIAVVNRTMGGGARVLVRGLNFAPMTVFSANAMPASNISCGSSTACTMELPPGTPGWAYLRAVTYCNDVQPQNCNGLTIFDRPSVSIPTYATDLFAYPGVKLSTAAVRVSENGGEGKYYVSLHTQPTANVQVAISVIAGTGTGTASPASLTFTPQNYAEPQLVTVAGSDDGGATGATAFTVRQTASSADASYNGLQADKAIAVVDNDTKQFFITQAGDLVTTRTGATGTFSMVMTKAPAHPVIVKVVSNDPVAGTVGPMTLGFDTSTGNPTSWNTPRTLTITGRADNTPGVARGYRIILTSKSDDLDYHNAGGGLADVAVTNLDGLTAPTGLTLVRTGPDRARVTFNTQPDAQYYRIKFSTTPGGPRTLLASIAMPGHILTGLTPGQQYYFVISSLNAAGQSSDSAEVPFQVGSSAPFSSFDGDGKADMVFQSYSGQWNILSSVGGFTSSTSVVPSALSSLPVPGDYDGDGRQDIAIYDDWTGEWWVRQSSGGTLRVTLGGVGHRPVPGDYDGDGRTDPAAYRLSNGQWTAALSSTGYVTTISVTWGGGGYVPIPGQDFDGDLKSDIAVYRQSTGSWHILKSSTNYTTTITKEWGGFGYALVPGDYDGDGKGDLGLYRRSTGVWSVLLSGANFTTALSQSWGGVGYLPVAADFDGDGKADLGRFEQGTGKWQVLLSGAGFTTTVSTNAWGTTADRLISTTILVAGDDVTRAADFDDDGRADFTAYSPSSGSWLTQLTGREAGFFGAWGGGGYTPVPGDYDGDGRLDRGAYQNATGVWAIHLSSANFTTAMSKTVGGMPWIPMPGDYDFDGKTDFVVHNPATGQWFGLKSSTSYTTTVNVTYGGPGYTPITGDFDADGRTDLGVYRQSTGYWSVLLAATNYTTSLNRTVGGPDWTPAHSDYDGDGKTDFVVHNAATGQWYGLKSSTGYTATVNAFWGGPGYAPVRGDYDGDGRADLAVFKASDPSRGWFVLLSSTNYTTSRARSLPDLDSSAVALPRYP